MEWKKWIDGGMAQWNEVNGLLSPDRAEGSGVASGRRLSHAAAGWRGDGVAAGEVARLDAPGILHARRAEELVRPGQAVFSGMKEWRSSVFQSPGPVSVRPISS